MSTPFPGNVTKPQEHLDMAKGGKHGEEKEALVSRPPRPVIGLEAEFSLFVQDRRRRPEHHREGIHHHEAEGNRGGLSQMPCFRLQPREHQALRTYRA